MTDAATILCIRELCRQHCHPGVNIGTHALADAVIALCDRSDTVVKANAAYQRDMESKEENRP